MKEKKTLEQFEEFINGAQEMYDRMRIIESFICLECRGTCFNSVTGEHTGEAVVSTIPHVCSHDKEVVDAKALPEWVRQRAHCGCCGYL